MYLFKPFETQEECDKALEYLLGKFPRDIDKLRIATFLGRYEVTKQYLKEGEVKIADLLRLKQEREKKEQEGE